jgi:transposase
MKVISNKYKIVADFVYKLCRVAGIKLYSSRFSRKDFTQIQHIFLLVYKQFRRFTYEELLTDLANNKELRVYLGLNKLPHYTTLIKFAKRLPTIVLDKLLMSFKKFIPKPERIAIDATGISLDNASPHYCKRIGLPTKKRPFMKTTFIVDIDRYILLSCKQRKKTRHDTIDAKPIIEKIALHYRPKVFYADRGYDKEELFKLVFEKLGAYPLILQKRLDIPKYKRKGIYRKQTFEVFDYGEYLQRNKIETCNSMFKRRFGSSVKARLDKTQRIEILARVIAFNIDRLLRISKEVLLFICIKVRISY